MNLMKSLTNTILGAIIALPISAGELPRTLPDLSAWARSNSALEDVVEAKVRKSGQETPRSPEGLSLQAVFKCVAPDEQMYMLSWGLWTQSQLAMWKAVFSGFQGKSVRVDNQVILEFERLIWKRAELTPVETEYMEDQLKIIFRDCLKEVPV